MTSNDDLRSTLRVLSVALLLPALSLFAGCGGDAGTIPASSVGGSSGAAVTLESNHAAAASIPTSGGTLHTSSSSGAQAALTVLNGSLLQPTTVTMVPISALSLSQGQSRSLSSRAGAPLPGAVLAGVQLSPDGLQLYKPATLALQLPSGTDMTSVVGLSYSGNGQDLHAIPVTISGTNVTFTLTHFSGYAAARLSAADIARLSTSSAAASALQQLAVLSAEAPPDVVGEANVLSTWYSSSVKPQLTAAGSDATRLNAALREWVSWETTVQQLGISSLTAQTADATHLAAVALRNGVDEANQSCGTDGVSSVGDATRKVLTYLAIAQKLGIDTVANGLDYESNVTNLCLQLKVTVTNPQLQAGGSTIVTASLQFGDVFSPSLGGKPVEFFLSGPGSLSASSATTNQQGQAGVTYTASSSGGNATIAASYDVGAPLPITRAVEINVGGGGGGTSQDLVISHLDTNDAGVLIISGRFLRDPGPDKRTVTIEGNPLTVQSWDTSQIATTLPPDAAGNVVVAIGGDRSVPVPLTEWRGTATVTSVVTSIGLGSTGSVTRTLSMDVHIRADVHNGGVSFESHEGLNPSFSVAGRFTLVDGTLVSFSQNAGGPMSASESGSLLPAQGVLQIDMDGILSNGELETLTKDGQTSGSVHDLTVSYAPTASFPMDADYRVSGGTATQTNATGTTTLTLSSLVPSFVPPPDMPPG